MIKEIELPGILNEYCYSQFYVHRDSLFLIPRKEFYSSLYLNEDQSKWEILPNYRVPLYEDARFVVTSICSGEWGGTAIFTDKITGEQYADAATCAEFVQKWGHSYHVTSYMPHLTTSMSIQRIDNPAGRLHPVRSVEGVVEDCGVCSYSSNVDSVQYLWLKADGQRESQLAKERYGFMIIASDGIKLYF